MTFRLNLEQQKKRAKDLLRAARAEEPAALQRLAKPDPKLADAQYVIARELGTAGWPQLRQHILSMERERSALSSARNVPDDDLRTLHVRCGNDIERALRSARFSGDFLEHAYPYAHGPVSDAPGCLEERARYLADANTSRGLEYQPMLERLRDGEQRLLASADYDRVVIWSEHDRWDQLALARLLAHYARHRRPRVLELVEIDRFPGDSTFIGLGQLPPEALRLLWSTRRAVTLTQLSTGLATWQALASRDPRALAALARVRRRSLPNLSAALLRQLRELPSTHNGLSITEELLLTLLCEAARTQNELFRALVYERDPVSGVADLQVSDWIGSMERTGSALIERQAQGERRPWSDLLRITALGRDVLAGHVDWRSLDPPPRWVGGVRIEGRMPPWRWNETAREPVRA